MRLRALAAWILLPPLLGVALAAWFVGYAVSDERAEMEQVGALALSGDVVADANGFAAGKVADLDALDAFSYDHPGLSFYKQSADLMRESMTRDQLFQALQATEDLAANLLPRLAAVGDAPPEVAAVLERLDREVLDAIAAGEVGLVDPEPYSVALNWLQGEYLDSDTRAEDASTALLAVTSRPPYWRDRQFLGFAIALVLLAVTGSLLALWRVSSSSRSRDERLAKAERRSDQLHQIVTTARRLSADSDFSSLSRTLMTETRDLLRGDVAVLVRRDGSRLVPVVAKGDLPVGAITTGDGAIGRCVETGAVTRTVVPSDPFLPGAPGPLALLAAPLVADAHVIGAIAVASNSSTMFDENDESALQLLALLAAGAVTAAQRYDSTVALALHDPLTGLANRRRLDHDLATAAVTEEHVGFLMVDIDHFKSFNDLHGHQRGDELLRAVGAAISSAVRQGDVVYRYGGEEFCVLLPATDAATAAVVAERVRAAVISSTALTPHPVTVSVGVAAQTAPLSPTDLVDRADAALYAAKQAGRDRVALA
jgi:diguanylate cyclase (GGDEF)-like protein